MKWREKRQAKAVQKKRGKNTKMNFQHHGQLIGLIKPRTSQGFPLNQSSLSTNQTCSFITSFANRLSLHLVALTIVHGAKVGPVFILNLQLQSNWGPTSCSFNTDVHTNTHSSMVTSCFEGV